MAHAYIVDAVRTAGGRRGGRLAGVHPVDMGAAVFDAIAARNDFDLAAIDDVIARGKRQDWVDLRRVALNDRAMMEKILRVCQAHIADPYAQRYHFWKQYVERYLA